jgi:LacI family transcriptional regulator
MKTPTQAEIAAALGVSQNTVSLALRGDPRLPEATRERVRAEAERRGYRPDPLIAALMARVRGGGAAGARGGLGVVLAGPKRRDRARHPSLARALRGGRDRAEELGYGWTEFWPADEGLRPARLAAVLEARGIRGLLLHPDEDSEGLPELPWARYASAVLALLDRRFASWPTASISPFRHVEMALQQAWARGARSAGLALPARYDRLLGRLYTGAMASAEALFPGLRVAPCFLPEDWNEAGFARWWRKHRPEVVLTRAVEAKEWLRAAGARVPEQTGCVHLGWNAGLGNEWAGVDPQPEVVGAACVDLVVEQLMHNESGLPVNPKVVLTGGCWVEGASLAPRRQG